MLQRALFEVHRRLLEGDYSMTSGSTAPVVTRFLVNQPQANHLLQRYALQCLYVSVADGLYTKACANTTSVHL